MSQFNTDFPSNGLTQQAALSGLDVNQQAWQATTGAAIEAERERAAHSWSADGLWTTIGKANLEMFSVGLYDAGPRSGLSAVQNFYADTGLQQPFTDAIDPNHTRDSQGRLNVNRDDISLGYTGNLLQSVRNAYSSEGKPRNEAAVALYGVDDQGKLFDEDTLGKMFNATSEFELAHLRARALRDREAGFRRQSMSAPVNFAVSFAGGFTDPTMLLAGMGAGAAGGAITNSFLTTTLEEGGAMMTMPGTASTIKNLAARGLISGVENIGQSIALNALAGEDYTWHDAMRDMAFGSTFGLVMGGGEAVKQAAEIRMASERMKGAAEILSMVNKGIDASDKGAIFFQHVPGLTPSSTPLDIASAEMARVGAMDHVETAGGGKSSFDWLVGRDVQMDGIGTVTVTGVEHGTNVDGTPTREIVGTIDGRTVKMDPFGVSIDRGDLMQPGARVRLDDGTLGTIETIKTESTPFADATRVPRQGDAATTMQVRGDDGTIHNLNPDEFLARSGTAVVRRGQVVFDPANSQRAIVAFGKARDVSTLSHEMGHVFRRTLNDIDPELSQKINDHYGQSSHDWNSTGEEAFARDFEQYAKEGKAPTKELQSTFERFAAWLSDLWQSIGGNKTELTDVQREAFGKLLDSEQGKAINGELGSRYTAVRDQLRSVLGQGEHADAVNSMMLANAKAWSRATGRNIDEYFSNVLAGFTSSLRNPFSAPIRTLPAPRPIIAKGRPSGFIASYLDGLISHIDMPGRAQREAQLLGLSDPQDARAKWRQGLVEKRLADEQTAREQDQASAQTMIDAKDAHVRERMVVVGHAIDRDLSREAFTADRVGQIQADIGIKARSWLFQNNSDVVKVDPRQSQQIKFNTDGTISVNHSFVHMHAVDRMAAFSGPLMHVELLRDAIDSGVRPDSPELGAFIESYGFDKSQADLHAIAVGRLFRQIDQRTGTGASRKVPIVSEGATPKPVAEPVATVENKVSTINQEATPMKSYSREAIRQRMIDAADRLNPMTAEEMAVAKGKQEFGEDYFNEEMISFQWPDKLPTEVVEALRNEPQHVQEMFTAGNGIGRGADTMYEIGLDAMLDIARSGTGTTMRYAPKVGDVFQGHKIEVIAKGELQRKTQMAKDTIAAFGEPNASLLAWMHDNPSGVKRRTILKPQEIGTRSLLKINGKHFEVQDSKQGFRELVGINGNEGVRIPLDTLEEVPADAGTFIQGNRWRGPKPAETETVTAAAEPKPVEIPIEHDLPQMTVTESGETAPPAQMEWNPLTEEWYDPSTDPAIYSNSPNELAQDALDLKTTIDSEDQNGKIPSVTSKGLGATGGRGVRTVNGTYRADRVGKLKQMDHPLLNVMTNAIFTDPLLDSTGKRGNANAEQFDALHMHATVDGYLRQMHDHVTAGAKAAGIGKINIPARMRFETQFREQVGKAVRDPNFNTNDANLKAAVETTRQTLRKIGQLGKDNFVKNFDKFALDDNYLTRVWDFNKLHEMTKTHTPAEVSNLFQRAVLDARPNLTAAEARILGDSLQTKLFNYGKEAGIDRNGFAAGLSNREYLLNTLEANGVDESTRLAIADKVAIDRDNTSTLSVAKRRTILNEKASIVTAKGDRIAIEDLLNNDAMSIVHKYGQQVIAEAAMTQVRRQIGAKVGLQWSNDAAMLEYLAGDMSKAGYSKPEINKALYLLDTGIKRLRGIALDDSGAITDNAWRVRQFAALAGNGSFGIPAMFELGHAITRLGVRTTMANMPAVFSAWRAMRRGEVNDPALKAMLYTIGIGHDTVSARYFGSWEHGHDPFETAGQGRMAKFDKGLAAAARASRFLSGVPQVTEFSRLLAANGVQAKMAQQAFSGKAPSARRLAWLGIDLARWNAVADQIKANHQKGPGGLVDVQLDGGGWTDMQAKHDYIEAVRSSVNTIIQEGGIGASHPWLETELGKLIFQFRQFGIMAYSRQTLAQVQIGDNEAYGLGMAAAIPIGLMQYMASTYLSSIGRNDQDEYMARMTTPGRMAIAAFSRASFSSIAPVAYDTLASSLGAETLGGFRSSGLESDPLLGNPTFAILTAGRKGVGGGIRSLFDPNYQFSDQDIKGIRNVVPFSRLPGTATMWNWLQNQTPSHSLQGVSNP